jgi:hypothetical protein
VLIVLPRNPPPYELEACFVFRESNGQQIAYVYFEDAPGRRSAANLLNKDEARRIAANIAKLPELVTEAKIKFRAISVRFQRAF